MGFVLFFCVSMYYVILPIMYYRRGTLFSKATYNKERQHRKVLKCIRRTISEKVNKAVKDGRFEVEIIMDFDTFQNISKDEVEDMINEEYDGQVKIERYGVGWAGQSFELKIVK